MGFIRLLLIIVLIYYTWKLVSRYILLPLFQGYYTNAGNNQKNKQYRRKKEGETIINNSTEKKKFIAKDTGEYIDYEEIKD